MSTPRTPAPNRRAHLHAAPALAMLAAAACIGCNRDPAHKIQGHWGVDVAAMAVPEKVGDRLKGLSEEAQKAELSRIREEAGRVMLDISADHLTVDVGLDRQEARYAFRPGEGGAFQLDTEDGKGRKDTLSGRIDGDRLSLTWGATELLLVRR